MSTSLQERYLAFVRDRIEQLGFAPTIAEIADHFEVTPGTARSIVEALVRQGRLTRTSARTRNLAIPGEVDLSGVGTERLRAELARRGVTLDALDEPRLMRGRPCAANGCVSLVERGKLMCRPHWFALPAAMRSAIMNAWAGRHMQAYQEAVEAARDRLGGFTRVVERVE